MQIVVVAEPEPAAALAGDLRRRGHEVELHRELLAGEDDAEDAQWVVVVPDGGVGEAELEELADRYEGWVERG